MKNKVIITAVIAALITSQTATVFGASLSNVGDTQSRETLASFDATASDLGGVVVSVPEKMTLAKDSNDTFQASDYVTAYGQIGADVRLRVTASESILYTNKDVEDATKVTGIVDFGTKYWSSDELFQGYKDHDNAVKNAVTISIADMSSMQPGEYDGSVPFEIELEKMPVEKADWTTLAPGLYDDNFQLVATLPEYFNKMVETYDGNSDYIYTDADSKFINIKKHDMSLYPTVTTYVDGQIGVVKATCTKYNNYTIQLFTSYYYADNLNVKNYMISDASVYTTGITMQASKIENLYIQNIIGNTLDHSIAGNATTTFKNLKNVYYVGTIEQAHAELNSAFYLLTNLKSATWHCADGDFVPASD